MEVIATLMENVDPLEIGSGFFIDMAQLLGVCMRKSLPPLIENVDHQEIESVFSDSCSG